MRLHKNVFLFVQATAIVGALASVSQAQEKVDYCIHCSSPEKTYVCRVRSDSSAAQGQQIFCIMSVAQQFGHDSCSASNEPNACTGQLVEYQAPSPPPTTPVTDRDQTAAQQSEEQQVAPKNQEPKTLVEFSKQTVSATAKGIDSVGDKAGGAIKNTGEKLNSLAKNVGHNLKSATEKTVKCVSSFFTRCNE